MLGKIHGLSVQEKKSPLILLPCLFPFALQWTNGTNSEFGLMCVALIFYVFMTTFRVVYRTVNVVIALTETKIYKNVY